MLTTLARWLKRGDTFDPEDHRATHRLRVARALLAEVGIEPTVRHRAPSADPRAALPCRYHPDSPEFGRPHFTAYGFDQGACDYRYVTVWPEWVTDAMFEHAAYAACEIQSLRGAAGQAQINAARVAAGRA